MKQPKRILSTVLAAVFVLMLCCIPAAASGEVSGEPGPGGSGEGGGAPGEGTGATDTEVITLVPEEAEELTLEGVVELTTDVYADRVEIAGNAEISAPYPVIVFFKESFFFFFVLNTSSLSVSLSYIFHHI